MSDRSNISPYEIDESKFDLGSRPHDDPESRSVWSRNMIIARRMFEYYQPWIDRGKRLMDQYSGNIFTAKQRATYRQIEDKIPVEPRRMKSPIMALVGEIMNGKRSGQITTEGGSFDKTPDSAVRVQIANMCLKDMEKRTHERELMRDMLRDALVSCYPVWTWIDKGTPADGEDGELSATLLPWDSTAAGPFNWKRTSDINEIAIVDYLKYSELLRMFPDRKAAITEHHRGLHDLVKNDAEQLSSIEQWTGSMNASDRKSMHSLIYTSSSAAIAPNGFYETYTRCFPVEKNEEVAVNIFDVDDVLIRPGDFDDEQWAMAVQESGKVKGARYELADMTVKVLYVTKFTTTGLMLECEKHWFQWNARLPGCCYVPDVINGIPTGPGDDLSELVQKIAVAETEFLNSIRKSGKILVLRSGYIENIKEVPKEVSKDVGVIIVKKDAPIDLQNVIKDIDRRPSTVYGEYSEKLKAELEEVTRINSSMQGGSAPNQSDVSKQREISQGLIVQSGYVEKANQWWEAWQDLKCKMIPYFYDQIDILEIMDETTGDTSTVPINAPQRDQNGDVISVANDMTSIEYRWKIMPVDDSPTAKTLEYQQAIVFLNSVPGPVMNADPTGMLLARFMGSFGQSNRFLRDAAKALLKDAEQKQQQQAQGQQQQQQMEHSQQMAKLKNEADKIKKLGMSLSFTGDQLVQFPQLAGFLESVGFFESSEQIQNAANQQQQGTAGFAPASSPDSQEVPEQMPEPAMA